jgi:ribose transport system permease protein
MTDVAVVRPPVARRDATLAWLRTGGVYVAVAALLLFNFAFTENFATVDNLRLQLVQATPVIIVALGMALVIGTEGIDLSVGSVMALSAAVIPLYIGYGIWPAIGVALVVGLVVGLLNGFMVAVVGIQPIVATLAILVGGRGLALVFAGGRLTEVFDPTLASLGNDRLFGVLPYTVLTAAVLTALVALTVRRTTFGRRLVAIGGNREASLLAGLPVKRTLIGVYVLSGLFAAVAGVIATGRSGASNPSFVGLLIELSAITAVVVGGTPLTGGRVRILGTVMGAILMQLIIATMVSRNLGDSAARMVQAAIIIAAVYVQRERSRS